MEPLLPEHPRCADGRGRPWRDDRKALCGILFVLHTGLPWEWLPQELGFGSGMTCRRRLRDWQAAGVWDRLLRLLLEELHQAGQIDWERAAVDGSHIRAMRGGEHTGPSPVDRARPDSKHHLIVEGPGISSAVTSTGGNRHDSTQPFHLLDAIPRVRGPGRGRPRSRPRTMYADRGYDYPSFRRRLRNRGIQPKIAKRRVPHDSGPGKVRYLVERTFARLHGIRRLRVRYKHRADILTALSPALAAMPTPLKTHGETHSTERFRVTGCGRPDLRSRGIIVRVSGE